MGGQGAPFTTELGKKIHLYSEYFFSLLLPFGPVASVSVDLVWASLKFSCNPGLTLWDYCFDFLARSPFWSGAATPVLLSHAHPSCASVTFVIICRPGCLFGSPSSCVSFGLGFSSNPCLALVIPPGLSMDPSSALPSTPHPIGRRWQGGQTWGCLCGVHTSCSI